jgi:integrase
VVCRLARGERATQAQGLQIEKGRAETRNTNAAKGPGKKSTRPGTVGALAALWAHSQAGAKRQAHCRRVAEELNAVAGDLRPNQLTTVHFAACLNAWRAKYKPATVHHYGVYLRMLARAIAETAGIPNLHRAVGKLKNPKPRTEIVQPEELARLIENAAPWMRVFIVVTAALGLRHSEALDVRPSRYDRNAHTIAFKAKGGEIQTMPTTPEIEALFANAPKAEPGTDPTLIELYRGSRVSQNTTWWEWKKLKRAAGITRGITPHDLRRTLAVSSYELTKDLRLVWQILRHRNLATTARYLEHVDREHIGSILAEIWTPKGPVQ